MKATLNVPDDLWLQLERRAVDEGRGLQDVVADTIRQGLSQSSRGEKTAARHRVVLPLIIAPPGAPAFDLTGEDIDGILSAQEVKWAHEAAGR